MEFRKGTANRETDNRTVKLHLLLSVARGALKVKRGNVDVALCKSMDYRLVVAEHVEDVDRVLWSFDREQKKNRFFFFLIH